MAIQAAVVLLRNKNLAGMVRPKPCCHVQVFLREDVCRIAECHQRILIRLIVMGRSSLAPSRMAMLGESMHARPDGVADHRPSIASAVGIGASHDFDIDRSVMRRLVAARLAMTRLSAGASFQRLAFDSSAAARQRPSGHAERRYPFGGFGDRF
jgi:hypothetical protein